LQESRKSISEAETGELLPRYGSGSQFLLTPLSIEAKKGENKKKKGRARSRRYQEETVLDNRKGFRRLREAATTKRTSPHSTSRKAKNQEARGKSLNEAAPARGVASSGPVGPLTT